VDTSQNSLATLALAPSRASYGDILCVGFPEDERSGMQRTWATSWHNYFLDVLDESAIDAA
jgi:hypothetical protein